LLFATVAAGNGPADFTSANYASTKGQVATIAGNAPVQVVGAGVDWWNETINPFGSGTWIANTLFDPNATQGTGATRYRGDTGGAALDTFSDFTFSTSGVLTYGVAVPEPTAYGLLGGFGVLLIALRRQFCKA